MREKVKTKKSKWKNETRREAKTKGKEARGAERNEEEPGAEKT
jgi:hypothetical protein